MDGPLPPVEVQVRWVVPDDDLAARGLALLDAREREREALFQHPGARQGFLVGRWLVRTTLGERLGRPAEALRFVHNRWGAPRLDPAAGDGRLRFNLSHTHGLVALAVVGEGVEVGVDVELTERRSRTVEIADRFFAPAEVEALRRLPAERRRDRFFDYWTLKEAYIKARGMGLAIPLARFAFEVDADPIQIRLDPALGDVAARWRFDRWDVTPHHRIALAVASGRRAVRICEAGGAARLRDMWHGER
ncbi:MAG: 4-phosphopantetheinyl transferase [Proteobacteria bacterium]|nr:MAG: 4-phosphopantetheinyl transferase [Pseudomonadota bacterium]